MGCYQGSYISFSSTIVLPPYCLPRWSAPLNNKLALSYRTEVTTVHKVHDTALAIVIIVILVNRLINGGQPSGDEISKKGVSTSRVFQWGWAPCGRIRLNTYLRREMSLCYPVLELTGASARLTK